MPQLRRLLALVALLLCAGPSLAAPDDGEKWTCRINACPPAESR